MKPFLLKTAEYIVENYSNNPETLTVILPNRRGSLYLKKYLGSITDKPLFIPKIISIEDFIIELSGFQIADPVLLQFEFYKAYCIVEGENAKTFQEFFKWSAQVLSDFNETDMCLVNTDAIFRALDEASVIKTWNVGGALTPYQLRYLEFYRSLGKYYKALHDILSEKKTGYQGLVYRNAANNVSALLKKPGTFLFAGLNALTPSEEKIVFALYDAGKAKFLWDVDIYYFKNNIQEAGFFLRRYLKNIKEEDILWFGNDISQGKKKITITGVQGKVLQAKYAGNILENYISTYENYENTALVLADEKLLFPVLNSIPENIKKFNITMGVPLSQIPVVDIYNYLFKMHSGVRKSNETNNEQIYTKDLIRIMEHPYIFRYFGKKSHEIILQLRTCPAYINTDKAAALLSGEESAVPALLTLILKPWDENPSKVLTNLSAINEELINYFSKESSNVSNNNNLIIEYEYLLSCDSVIKRLQFLLKDFNLQVGIKPFYSLLKQAFKYIRLPFYGEPLQGLQIMGFLETRTLDFDKIILLSANEGILPSGKSKTTFIPADIRKSFGLPMLKDNDAIYAYHFYRLLQRSSEIHLVYNTKQDVFNGGEKSRFINQIEHELKKSNPEVEIINNLYTFNNIAYSKDVPIIIRKNDKIFDKLKQRGAKGFAPSALNCFIACPLKFYFREIAEIPETDDDYSAINHARFGSAVHDVLNTLYENIKNTEITPLLITRIIDDIEKVTYDVFRKAYPDIDITSGKNLLAFEAVKRVTANFLRAEKKRIEKVPEKYIVSLMEEMLRFNYGTIVNDEKIDFTIKGKADRIDVNGNVARIIDYKTGQTDIKELIVNEPEELIENSNLAKCFQLMMYAFLFSKSEHCKADFLEAGIIPVARPTAGIMKATFCGAEVFDKETLSKTHELILKVIHKIFNKDIPFTQTENIDNCRFCGYITICSRD